MFPYAPPGPTPFQSDKLNSEKSPSRKGRKIFIVTPIWQTQPCYSFLLVMSMQCPLLLTPLPDLLLGHPVNNHF